MGGPYFCVPPKHDWSLSKKPQTFPASQAIADGGCGFERRYHPQLHLVDSYRLWLYQASCRNDLSLNMYRLSSSTFVT